MNSFTKETKRQLSQSRKKAILEGVQKRRRAQRLVTLTIVIIIIGIVIGAVAFYPRTTNAVPLPSYLDRCIFNSPYHYHPGLVININGSNYPILPDIGRSGSCDRPLHTHPSNSNPNVYDGTIHVESDENRDYTLGDFFLIWGNSANNPNFAIFNSNQIFTNHVAAGHTLTVTVNGLSNPGFQNLVFLKSADPQTNPFNVVITYS